MTQNTDVAVATAYIHEAISKALAGSLSAPVDVVRAMSDAVDAAFEHMSDEMPIYAGQLRQMGCEIDERIPDCAWVRRRAIVFAPATAEMEGKLVRVRMSATVNEPFHWVEATISVG
jgi:hypothetical protein